MYLSKKLILFCFLIPYSIVLLAQEKPEPHMSTSSEFNLEQSLLQNGYVGIPMTKLISGHLQLKATINGVEGHFILDTGAGGTVIEQKRNQQFRLQSEDTDETATGAGGTNLQMQMSLGNTIHFGSLRIENFELTLMSLDHVNNAFQRLGIEEVDGVIGADILTSQTAIIDYSNLMLYLKKE